MLEVGLRSYLLEQSAICGVIGDRIHPIPAPEDLSKYPCVTFKEISHLGSYTNDGPTGWNQQRLLYQCRAASWLQARQLRDLLKAALEAFSGQLSEGTSVFLIEVENADQFYDSDMRMHCSGLYVLVQYGE